MRSSSVIILRRASERTRAISATSDTGLVRKSSAPASRPAHAVGRLVERRDHDHRNVMGGRIVLEPAADLEAVHVGHHHVEQHDVAFRALADRQRLAAAMAVMTSKYSADSRASSSLTLAGTSSTTRTRAVIDAFFHALPRKWRMVSMNLPTEIGLDR